MQTEHHQPAAKETPSQSRWHGAPTRPAKVIIGVLLALSALSAFVLYWFQPQKLFIDDRVDEPPPVAAAPATPSAPSAPASPAAPAAPPTSTSPTPREILTGQFRSLEHGTSGRAIVLARPDGSRVLRFEDLDTSNGPDLRVILSSAPSTAGDRAFGADYVELGKHKGNIGDQNYEIPADVDLSVYASAVVWCARFRVGFGVAGLSLLSAESHASDEERRAFGA